MTLPYRDHPVEVAIITGAGWKPFNEWKLKGIWRERVPQRTPELFWPLPGWETVCSRLVKQLGVHGVEQVFVGIGAPGSDPEPVEYRHSRKWDFQLSGRGQPVWTEESRGYIKSLGAIPLLMEDPHAPGVCCWHTMREMLHHVIRSTGWTRVICLAGDYIFSTEFVEKLLYGCTSGSAQIWLLPRHSVEILRREDVGGFLDHLRELPKMNQKFSWTEHKRLSEIAPISIQYIWDFPDKSWEPERIKEHNAARRKHFCEAGPGEYPFGWALAERDPV